MRMPKMFKSAVASFVCALGLIGMTAPAEAGPAVGTVGQWSRDNKLIRSQFDLMKYRNLTRYRFDVYMTADQDAYAVSTLKMMQLEAKLRGITLRPILVTSFAFGDRTDYGKVKGTSEDLYRTAYNRTYALVNEFKYEINDWELGNEINLMQRDASGQPLWGKGFTATEFDTQTMNDWALVLKGMSDAIEKINKDNGLQLRRILNTTSTHFGFLDYMEKKGVKYEVISYHYYERLGTNPNNYWGSFNLFQKLATYKRPVHFNEVNCAEIYDPAYQNAHGGNMTEACNKSLNNTLNYIFNQNYVKVEDVDIYELVDHPEKGGSEAKFGMMQDMRQLKVAIMTAALYAGGTLTADEKAFMTRRGFPNIQK